VRVRYWSRVYVNHSHIWRWYSHISYSFAGIRNGEEIGRQSVADGRINTCWLQTTYTIPHVSNFSPKQTQRGASCHVEWSYKLRLCFRNNSLKAQKSTNSKAVRYEYSNSVYEWQWRYFQQQTEAVNGSCNELCGYLKVQWPSLKHCDWGNALWTTCWISPCQYTTISGSCMHLTLGVFRHLTLCVLLTSLNIRSGGKNWPAPLQHVIL
jgi:hypothetical protein